jgi:hypothetical protein
MDGVLHIEWFNVGILAVAAVVYAVFVLRPRIGADKSSECREKYRKLVIDGYKTRKLEKTKDMDWDTLLAGVVVEGIAHKLRWNEELTDSQKAILKEYQERQERPL